VVVDPVTVPDHTITDDSIGFAHTVWRAPHAVANVTEHTSKEKLRELIGATELSLQPSVQVAAALLRKKLVSVQHDPLRLKAFAVKLVFLNILKSVRDRRGVQARRMIRVALCLLYKGCQICVKGACRLCEGSVTVGNCNNCPKIR
jgi:hypothetical protein